MAKASDNLFPKVILVEGSAPSNPASGDQALFIDSSTHHLKRVNSSGTVTDIESGAASSPLLAVVAYAPVGDTATTTTGTSFSDVDATHLAITFTAPASGNVLVRITVPAGASNASNNTFLNLRESTSDLSGCSRIMADGSGGLIHNQAFCFYLTGVSAGSHTYKLGFKTSNAGTACEVYLGPTYGQAVLEVWAN